jgi:hypothetical protein
MPTARMKPAVDAYSRLWMNPDTVLSLNEANSSSLAGSPGALKK